MHNAVDSVKDKNYYQILTVILYLCIYLHSLHFTVMT